jgi:hypothetical protein
MAEASGSPHGAPLSSSAPVPDLPRSTSDARVLPPLRRDVASASGRFLLVVSSDDQWRTPFARGELFERRQGALQSLWRTDLPHVQGPRWVTVLDSGALILVDDWINSPSEQALTLISPKGHALARYSLDDLIRFLKVPPRRVTDQARHGLWLSTLPLLTGDGKEVEIQSAGKTFWIRLSDGKLRLND